MMTKTGMLVVSNPSKFVRYVPRLQKEIEKTLYVQILPPGRQVVKYETGIQKYFAPSFSSSVKSIYCESVSFKSLDVRIILSGIRNPYVSKICTKKPIEIVYFDQQLNCDEMNGFINNFVLNRTSDCQVVSLEQVSGGNGFVLQEDCEVFNNVVLGGTFDRLHCGHKALLSEAALRCNQKLTIGVTNTDMLKTKKLWELIEPCETRMAKVKEFLDDVDPHLEVDIIPIGDVFGPTKDDPSFQALIVSCETLKGSKMVNDERSRRGLLPLVVRAVDLIPDTKRDEIEEDKISSSNDRIRLLGTRIHQPQERPNLSKWPYIIGLTGGIGSGKSSVSDKLSKKGAGLINCDTVAHTLYVKGGPCYKDIIETFGESVVSPEGEIDRKALAAIVFSDKEKLKTLNGLIWPKLLERVKEIIIELHKNGKEIIVMEAAVLLEAGWHQECHEVWATIIPPQEAVKRLQERSKMTEEEAQLRLSSQPSNSEYVESANVVISTLWHPEYTQKQVDRAWDLLQSYLSSRNCR